MKNKQYLTIGFILMAISIALGALGAHSLEKEMLPKYFAVFNTGAKYLTLHSLALILLSSIEKLKYLRWCRLFIFIGVIFFCGNCFLYSFFEQKIFAMLVPIGGIFLIAGWLTGSFELNKRNASK